MENDFEFECLDHGTKPHQWCRGCERVTLNRRRYRMEVFPLVAGEMCKTTFGRVDTCCCSSCRVSI